MEITESEYLYALEEKNESNDDNRIEDFISLSVNELLIVILLKHLNQKK